MFAAAVCVAVLTLIAIAAIIGGGIWYWRDSGRGPRA